ncbi:MAG: type II toxin-antitoxin system HipA family toxin [Syntrophaceae bacterium]|nr:type II toxin-antitoxin system HipA family toxin [Syntrophaceae bacterium]
MINHISPKLAVYFQDNLAGHLWLDSERRFVFQYTRDWAKSSRAVPLSVALPLQEEAFENDKSRSFFANLLPEAQIRIIISRNLQISDKNDFALLEKIGGECAGAISLFPEGLMPQVNPGYRKLDKESLHNIIISLPQRPLLAGEEGLRLSLAGAQNKLPVYVENEEISIATGNAPSTHILKPPIPGLPDSVENEAFCMILAGNMGLPVPRVKIFHTPDAFLLIERYDRIWDKKRHLQRLHQEDFCQALQTMPDQKYESEGGPSLPQCFNVLSLYSLKPAADKKALLRWIIFNVLIGNADAHAKNLALLYHERKPSLAPFYDLICTMAYEELTDKLAMKIGTENRVTWLGLRHWENFAETVEIKKSLVLKELAKMSGEVILKAEDLAQSFIKDHGDIKIISRILEKIRKNAMQVKY